MDWWEKSDCKERLEPSCIPVHPYDALKGRPRVLRTVKPLLGYPRGSPYVLEANGWSSLSLLACTWVQEQRIVGQPEKRIIRGGCLGSSVLNTSHLPLLYRWAGQGELVQLQLPLATLHFSAQAKTGADHTITKLHLSQEWRGPSDTFNIHAVHVT